MVFAGSNPKFTRSGGDDATDEAAAG
jgi:hypothetical protein